MGDYDRWAGVLVIMTIFALHLTDYIFPGTNDDEFQLAQDDYEYELVNKETPTRKKPASDSDSLETMQTLAVSNVPTTNNDNEEDKVDKITVYSSKQPSMVDPNRSVYMVHFGVVAHSVILGIVLGVSGLKTLKMLMVVMAINQFIEGVAIGERLHDLYMLRKSNTTLDKQNTKKNKVVPTQPEA
ncbi:hypothetical protein AX774_g2017 [Zancudomyces culisetae]|uniref:Uncharacterized protein n=1 Tax=Zancudomyces culisetae TaxID=1213189 RepID=A0A1R1PU27_ZANCU|nr:hypothetical protein AX774_g2017 [Zancudomyces culisetae]|eukprot:OMH84461.1 hypothetical protein AX774_g2017 [Zancudomyces culisetae]